MLLRAKYVNGEVLSMRDLGAYIGEEFSVDARKVSAAKAAIVAVSDVLTSDDGFGLFSGKKLSLKNCVSESSAPR